MTPTEAVALFDRWGLSSAEAAQLLGRTHASVCRWHRMAIGAGSIRLAPLDDPFWCHILAALDPEQHGANLRNILRLSGRATAYLYLLTAHSELHPAAQLRHPALTGP
jgi:hypothetical protein